MISRLKLINSIAFLVLLLLFFSGPLSVNSYYDNNQRDPATGQVLLKPMESATYAASDFIFARFPESYYTMPHNLSSHSIDFYRFGAVGAALVLLLGVFLQPLLKVSRFYAGLMIVLLLGLLFCEICVDDFKNFYFEYASFTGNKVSSSIMIDCKNTATWTAMNCILFAAFVFNVVYFFRQKPFAAMRLFRTGAVE